MRHAWDKRHTPKDFGNVGLRFEGDQQPSGNSSNFSTAAVNQSSSKVLAKALFEEIPVALL